MASNRTDRVQSSSSQPPAKTTSCLPSWICSAAGADAVGRGGARRGDRIVQAADLEPGRKRRRGARAHRLGHRERADALGALLAGDVGGLDDGAGRGPARADDQAGALVARPHPAPGPNRRSPAPWRCGRRRCPAARKRAARRSTMDSQSILDGACTWQRKPSSAYSGAATTPEPGLAQGGGDLVGGDRRSRRRCRSQ